MGSGSYAFVAATAVRRAVLGREGLTPGTLQHTK